MSPAPLLYLRNILFSGGYDRNVHAAAVYGKTVIVVERNDAGRVDPVFHQLFGRAELQRKVR